MDLKGLHERIYHVDFLLFSAISPLSELAKNDLYGSEQKKETQLSCERATSPNIIAIASVKVNPINNDSRTRAMQK